MTDIQLKILEFICEFISGRGFPPTVREISRAFGWNTTSNVQQHLERMQRDGLITREKDMARTVRPTPAGGEQLEQARREVAT